MGLYKLFSYNVEIQYKSYFLSKAMLFTFITSILTIVLPYIVAYRSRGFWLKSYHFFEQPTVRFTFEYLLVAETDDPNQAIVCAEAASLNNYTEIDEEYCGNMTVHENDLDGDGKNDMMEFKYHLYIPNEKKIVSIMLFLALDFQLMIECPLHMQSLAIIDKDFAVPPSRLKYFGDLEFYQVVHLPCLRHHIDTSYNVSSFDYHNDNYNVSLFDNNNDNYNVSLFDNSNDKNNVSLFDNHTENCNVDNRTDSYNVSLFDNDNNNDNCSISLFDNRHDNYNLSLFDYLNNNNQTVVDFILDRYFSREVTTKTNTLYSRIQNGDTGEFDLDIRLRIPEVKVTYQTSLLQELKWAWPQYLSIAFIFYWAFYQINRFVFVNRLVMAWEVIPWKLKSS